MRLTSFAFLTVAVVASACSSKQPAPGQTVPPPGVTITVKPTTVAQDGTVHLSIKTTNFTLESDADSQTHAFDPAKGHYHVYLDSTETGPLTDDHAAELDLVIPGKTAVPGPHKLILRLQYEDHKIVTPETTSTVAITVTPGSASGTGGAGGAGGAGVGGVALGGAGGK